MRTLLTRPFEDRYCEHVENYDDGDDRLPCGPWWRIREHIWFTRHPHFKLDLHYNFGSFLCIKIIVHIYGQLFYAWVQCRAFSYVQWIIDCEWFMDITFSIEQLIHRLMKLCVCVCVNKLPENNCPFVTAVACRTLAEYKCNGLTILSKSALPCPPLSRGMCLHRPPRSNMLQLRPGVPTTRTHNKS